MEGTCWLTTALAYLGSWQIITVVTGNTDTGQPPFNLDDSSVLESCDPRKLRVRRYSGQTTSHFQFDIYGSILF